MTSFKIVDEIARYFLRLKGVGIARLWFDKGPALLELCSQRGANAAIAIVEIQIDFLLFQDKIRLYTSFISTTRIFYHSKHNILLIVGSIQIIVLFQVTDQRACLFNKAFPLFTYFVSFYMRRYTSTSADTIYN